MRVKITIFITANNQLEQNFKMDPMFIVSTKNQKVLKPKSKQFVFKISGCCQIQQRSVQYVFHTGKLTI